jgi:hypothetical protein
MIGSDPLSTEMSQSNLAHDALFAVAAPPLAPSHLGPDADDYQNFMAGLSDSDAAPAYAKASWLDAMPVDEFPFDDGFEGIAAVNADDNGLYRMFIGVSP